MAYHKTQTESLALGQIQVFLEPHLQQIHLFTAR